MHPHEPKQIPSSLSTGAAPSASGQSAADALGMNTHSGSFGIKIEAIAAWCGLQPADVAIAIAGVLGNIAGPYAGLVDSAGGRVHPHLNLIFTGTEHPRLRMLEDRLFQPLRKRADWLRQRASTRSRMLSDRFVFGNHTASTESRNATPAPFWLKQPDDENDEIQRLVINSQGLPRDQFNENELMSAQYYAGRDGDAVRRSPGISHLPSFFFEGITLAQIASALGESIHRDALVQHPRGGVFDSPTAASCSKDEVLAHELISRIKGADTQFTSMHPDQGHGTFEHALVHLWASIRMERIGEIIHDEKSPWQNLIKCCLICEPSQWKPSEGQQYDVAQAWRRFDHNVQEILQLRCFGRIQEQMRLNMGPQTETLYWQRQNLYLDQLVKITDNNSVFMAQLHDMPGRLLWVFKQFYTKGEPTWCLNAAFEAALHAAKQHNHLLKMAQENYVMQLNLKTIEQVTNILQQKGPVKLREVQRSCSNRAAGYFKPALAIMQQQGRLRLDGEKRLHLIAQS